jgi:L-fucose mutarotase/ribose pyranase (RbsD/FucU family)
MLKYELLHPEILATLGAAGHGSKVLIADGNYPFSTGSYVNARRVYLNLAPGLVKITDVLRLLVGAIPIEAAEVMVSKSGKEPGYLSRIPRDLACRCASETFRAVQILQCRARYRHGSGDCHRRTAGLRKHTADHWGRASTC